MDIDDTVYGAPPFDYEDTNLLKCNAFWSLSFMFFLSRKDLHLYAEKQYITYTITVIVDIINNKTKKDETATDLRHLLWRNFQNFFAYTNL